MSKINKTTIENALGILDAQLRHTKTQKTVIASAKQWAYYKGLRDMFEILLTDYFTNDNELWQHADGTHSAHFANRDIFKGKTFCVWTAGKKTGNGE